MKKNSIDFESRFWSGRNKHSALPLMEVFFQFHDLATAKEHLNRIMQYAVQGKTRIPEDPSVVFQFYQSLRSFVRAGWCLRKKPGKWIGESVPEHSSPLMHGSLSEEEYRDPVRVFRKAFRNTAWRNLKSSCRTWCISRLGRSTMCRSVILSARISISSKCWMRLG